MESLYEQWEKNSWRERWYLGLEAEEIEEPAFFGLKTCGFWLRALSWVVDSVLMTVVLLLFMWSLLAVGWLVYPRTEQGLLALGIGIIFVVMMLKNAYYTLLQGNNGQTVGQSVLGIKLVDAQGEPPSLRQAARRRSARFLSFITLGFGYFWMLIDPRRQTLHDKIAGTYVVMA